MADRQSSVDVPSGKPRFDNIATGLAAGLFVLSLLGLAWSLFDFASPPVVVGKVPAHARVFRLPLEQRP